MEQRQLGRSGLYVSKLALGTMTLGEADASSMFHGIGCPKDEAFKIIDHAFEQGINFLDSANVYGNDGLVEKLLGDYFSQRKNRHDFVLATKFRFAMGDGPFMKGASRKHIMMAIDDSLKRLKSDYIDLYQVHMQDNKTPEEETLRALDDLVKSGKVRYIGASNYAAYRFLDALYCSEKYNLHRYCSLQMQYSLVCREIELEHIPLSVKHGVAILAWSPLAGGFLSGKYQQSSGNKNARLSIKKEWAERFITERNAQILEAVMKVAHEIDESPSAISLAWLLKRRGLSSVIIGVRSMSQLNDNLKASELELSPEHLTFLDDKSALPKSYPYSFISSKGGDW
jgi:aryl-alcohol dehydrogenase-like predicted oxidoreductase